MKTIHISFGDNTRSITDANGRVWVFTVHESGKDAISAKISGVQPTEEEAKPFVAAVMLWIIQGCVVDANGKCQWVARRDSESAANRNYGADGKKQEDYFSW